MKIEFVNLKKQYNSIKKEIDNAIAAVIDSTSFIKGKYVDDFEREYALKYGVKHCISCANGTDAIYITLKALGIELGDEVITVSNSWISTSETITQTGAKPVFVDIDVDSYTIDVGKIEEKINANTKAIIPVHLFGHAANMDEIVSLCTKYNLFLIEDCAQAHFSKWKEKYVGTMGIAGTFSFFPGKNLGAYGDAGAIITNDDDLNYKARLYANHGSIIKHQHKIEGINSRLDGLQAAILSVKLKYIDSWNQNRLDLALYYNKKLKNIEHIILPKTHDNVKHVFHLYVIRVKLLRNDLKKYLEENGISTGLHYPCPLPFLEAYKYLGYKESDFPVSFQFKDQILSLPIYPELTFDEVDYITDKIKLFFK